MKSKESTEFLVCIRMGDVSVEARGQLAAAGPFFTPLGPWGWNFTHQS